MICFVRGSEALARPGLHRRTFLCFLRMLLMFSVDLVTGHKDSRYGKGVGEGFGVWSRGRQTHKYAYFVILTVYVPCTGNSSLSLCGMCILCCLIVLPSVSVDYALFEER